jgi:hypothetical protein
MKIEIDIDEKSVPSGVVGAVVGAVTCAAVPILIPLGLVAGALTGYWLKKTELSNQPKDPPKDK